MQEILQLRTLWRPKSYSLDEWNKSYMHHVLDCMYRAYSDNFPALTTLITHYSVLLSSAALHCNLSY